MQGRLKLLQKPYVILIEQPDIMYTVAHHDHAVDAEAEGEATPDFWINF